MKLAFAVPFTYEEILFRAKRRMFSPVIAESAEDDLVKVTMQLPAI